MSGLRKAIKNYISSYENKLRYDEVKNNIDSILDELVESGEIVLGHDKDLTGHSLEIRTKILFEQMGFEIRKGRQGLEDFVIEPPPNARPNEPLVLEVKSSRKPNIERKSLRQLDDWVFDLSGEEKARKEGLGGDADIEAMVFGGMSTSKKKHPSPHKGVMIFNGPIGIDFDKRNTSCVNENDIEFIEKRNFCIVPFGVLILYAEAYLKDNSIKEALWDKIHKTAGLLKPPS